MRRNGLDEGAGILSEVDAFIRRFCALPSDAAHTAVTLWAAHTHMFESFHTTPRLAFLSPEPGSGKTRALEILELLVAQPMLVVSPSAASIFRTMGQQKVTLLFDEVDTVFGRRGKEDQNEELRALMNVGYRRGSKIPRCVGPHHEVRLFDVYASCAMAGLGDLPGTLMTRAIVVRMHRRSPSEHVEPFRLRLHETEGHVLRDRLAEWANVVGETAGEAWPELPALVVDRFAEVWEPLIAVADAAREEWPERARTACLSMLSGAQQAQSLGVRLLCDLRFLFGEVDAMSTDDMLARLNGETPVARDAEGDAVYFHDAPWAALHAGKPLDARGLARLLRPYGIRPVKIKSGGRPLQGYRRGSLWDAWQRYCPEPPSGISTNAEPQEPAELDGLAPLGRDQLSRVPEVPKVPATAT